MLSVFVAVRWLAQQIPYLRHYDESSEVQPTARQHKVAEVACYRLERTLRGCADPPSNGGSVHPISVLE